jgi:hypothetical protein
MNIDDETSVLIVDAYRKINSLRKLLNENPCPGNKNLFKDINAVSKLMNKTLDENSERSLNKNLFRAKEVAFNLLNYYSENTCVSFSNKNEIVCFLDDLHNDLNNLYSKFNGQAYDVHNIPL